MSVGLVTMVGCGSTDPVHPDQDVTLQPGYGIAAVVFDTLDVLTTVTIKSPDNGTEVDVGSVGKGMNMYVYAVPAGSYCLTRFDTGFYRYHTNDQTHGVCFDVIAGKVAYSGNLAPRAYLEGVRTDQNYDWTGFEKVFKQDYPKLASLSIVTP